MKATKSVSEIYWPLGLKPCSETPKNLIFQRSNDHCLTFYKKAKLKGKIARKRFFNTYKNVIILGCKHESIKLMGLGRPKECYLLSSPLLKSLNIIICDVFMQ